MEPALFDMTMKQAKAIIYIKGIEKTYRFTDVETLVADFLEDIENARRGKI